MNLQRESRNRRLMLCTIYRWFIQYGPALRKKLRRYQFIRIDSSWQRDETYVKVKGKWYYLYRAINKRGETLDIWLRNDKSIIGFIYLLKLLATSPYMFLCCNGQSNNGFHV